MSHTKILEAETLDAVAIFNWGTRTTLHSLESVKPTPPIIAELQELLHNILDWPPIIDDLYER